MQKFDRIKQRVLNETTSDVVGIYYLIKELKCLPEIIGREFEVEYDGDKIKRIRQLPMKISTLTTLLQELKADYQRQKRQMEKSKVRK